jgi:hypothetical protein
VVVVVVPTVEAVVDPVLCTKPRLTSMEIQEELLQLPLEPAVRD